MPAPAAAPHAIDALAEFAADVRAGLAGPGQKELHSKYFYDQVGSALFEVITLLPEYGVTRAGERLLSENAADLARRLPLPVVVAELGSGSGVKTRWVLAALAARQERTVFYPIDISPAALAACERELGDIESVEVTSVEATYLAGLDLVVERRRNGDRMLILFLGGNIGNFERPKAEEFLRQIRRRLRPGDALLIATDLEKPAEQLIAAYDDPIGVTAAFNLNLLARINRELDADFALSQFRHLALYNEEERRVEMHLESTVDQTVTIRQADLTVSFREGETIWTESSHRYREEELAEIAERTGFCCEVQWIDSEWPFAQSLFVAE